MPNSIHISARCRTFAGVLVLCWQVHALPAQDALAPTTVVGSRRSALGLNLTDWNGIGVDEFAPRSIDQLLAQNPAFSLFRRQNATFANPTASGVSLNQTGASATSRSLVLLDGIPQNDPFGGWVPWVRFDPGALASAQIVSASESALWGNLSAAGSIQLNSEAIVKDQTRLRLSAGTQGTLGTSLSHHRISENGKIATAVQLFDLRNDGFNGLASDQRGSVDRKLNLEANGLNLRFNYRPSESLSIEPSLSFFQENRGNGTALSNNETEALDISLRLISRQGNSRTQLLAYYQRREFAASFASVSPDRNSERLALDQFDVPGEGIGAALTQSGSTGSFDYQLGADFRHLDGETNETIGTFRQRRAGGEQTFLGVFGQLEKDWSSATTVVANARLDHWRLDRGRRVETNFAGTSIFRNDRFSDRSGWEPSVAVTVNQRFSDSLTAHLSASTSFRAPTLNELYRPFRVRSDVTEANSELDPERFLTLETGMNWRPVDSLNLSATVFHHWINDAIANVPVTDATEIARIFGNLPTNGTGAQRQNVDRSSVFGVQARAEWNYSRIWTLRVDALYSRTHFIDSSRQALLEDNPFPQSPRWNLISTIEAQASDKLDLFAQASFTSRAFDDLQGDRELPSFWNFGFGATWQMSERHRLTARVDNLLDSEIKTGLASNGLQTVGQPRALWLELRSTF